VKLQPDLLESLASADDFAESFRSGVDKYIELTGSNYPEDHTRVNDERLKGAAIQVSTEFDTNAAGITTIIWATGYTPDFQWIDIPVFSQEGHPVHKRGVTKAPGLYFIGLPCLHKAKSPLLYGVGEDAAYISDHLLSRLNSISL
jgi:putative flavoprotein involved in K+ transport